MYQVVYADRIHLGVRALGTDLGGHSAAEARAALNAQFAKYAQSELVLRYSGKEWRTTLGALGIRFDVDATTRQALEVGRSGNLLQQTLDRIGALREGRTIAPVLSYDADRQATVIANLAREVDRPMVNASLLPKPDGTVEMIASQVGRKVDTAATLRRIQDAIGPGSAATVELVVVETPPRVVEAQLAAARATAEKILRAPLTIVHGSEQVKLDQKQLTAMLSFRQEGSNTVAELAEKDVADLVTKMAKTIDKKPKDARFRFVAGKVQILSDSVDGEKVDVAASTRAIREAALGETRIVPLVVEVTPPKARSSDLPNIVIREKIIEASTVYGDTGLDRQHNVKLAVSRLDGVVIPPGGTFSFNKELGPTGIPDGYKYGWGIVSTGSGHDTVRSEAGGICQVSTTIFHAAFWAGLQIDQRTEHLYWIPRYGKPPLGRTGLDSTVDGSGSPDTLDFKFTNNTPNWMAIEGRWDAQNIYFALYGTKPTWTVEVQDPVITNVVKADPTQVRIEDKDIPPGTEVWVELAQDGFDVSVRRIVREGGRVLSEYVVKSHYSPARNVIRFNPATPTPTGSPQTTGTPGPTASNTPAPPAATPQAQPTAVPKPQPTAIPSPRP